MVYVFEQGSSIVRSLTLPSPTLSPTCDGSWHSILQTYSGGTGTQVMRTFMDGNLMSAAAVSLDLSGTNSTPLYIGFSGEAGSARSFSGSISDVRIFGRPLTCAEAQAMALPPLPAVSGGFSTPATLSPGATSATFQCNVGFSGLKSTYSKNTAGDQSWAFSPTTPSCTACATGTFANGLTCSSVVATCGALPTYSLGGGATTGCCTTPATVATATGCAPNGASSAVAGPTDTVFAFTGSAAEGLGGLQPTGSGIGFLSDRYNSPISALQLGTGGNVQASGAALQAVLPAPGAAASISANVLCTLPPASTANMTALEWAAPSAPDSGARLALTVTGIANSPALVGTASTPVPSSAGLSLPKQGVFDAAGNFYFVWGNYIGVVSPAGVYTTLLGSGTAARVDGVGLAASLYGPTGIAISADFLTIYWSESFTGMVRQANLATLQTSTFVGTGGSGYQEGVGTAAAFVAPICLSIDYVRGVMYVADSTGGRVRAINMATRATSTLAGNGAKGNADGVGTACTLTLPYGIAVEQSSGNVYVSDGNGNKIRMITSAGVCTTFAGPAGDLNGAAGAVDGQGTNAQFSAPRGIGFDLAGFLYVADSGNNKVRRVTPYGVVSSVTGLPNTPVTAVSNGGNGGALSGVGFNVPFGVTADSSGNVWVIESTGLVVRKLTFAQAPTALAPVCDGAWHNVVTTFSGGANPQTVLTYVDGYLSSSAQLAVATTGATSSPLTVGANGEGAAANAASQFVGALSDVRVYARALQASEAANLSVPVLPSIAGAAASPARAQGITSYSVACLAGYAGPPARSFARQPDNSWLLSGEVNCSACPINTHSAVTATGATVCTTCTDISPNAIAPSPASQYCQCKANFYQTGPPAAFTCTACPDGSTATGGPRCVAIYSPRARPIHKLLLPSHPPTLPPARSALTSPALSLRSFPAVLAPAAPTSSLWARARACSACAPRASRRRARAPPRPALRPARPAPTPSRLAARASPAPRTASAAPMRAPARAAPTRRATAWPARRSCARPAPATP